MKDGQKTEDEKGACPHGGPKSKPKHSNVWQVHTRMCSKMKMNGINNNNINDYYH